MHRGMGWKSRPEEEEGRRYFQQKACVVQSQVAEECGKWVCSCKESPQRAVRPWGRPREENFQV